MRKKREKGYPRIVAVIPCWQRPVILELTISMLPSWLYGVVFVTSPEDPRQGELLDVIAGCDIPMVHAMHMNRPLGSKLNHGVRTAMENFKFDYLMNMGSDDIIHEGLIDGYWSNLVERGIDWWPKNTMMGVNSCDWVSPEHRKAYRIKYYDVPIIIGAGRLTSYDILKKCGGMMNDPEKRRSMDTDSQIRIYEAFKVNQLQFDMSGYVLDVKSSVNINKFEQLETADIEREELTLAYIETRYGIQV